MKHVKELDQEVSCKAFEFNGSICHDHMYYCKTDLVHPLTHSSDRYVVGDRFHDGKKSGHKKETCKYHHIDNCFELKTYKSVLSEVIN